MPLFPSTARNQRRAARASAAAYLVSITTLKKLAARAKIPVAAEWIHEFLGSTDRKLLVFAHHKEVIDALAAACGALVIDGRTRDVASQVESFQTDPGRRVCVVGITAGGVGLTLTAATDELFVEQVWTSVEHDQAEARAWGRMNDPHGVTATYLLAVDTIDELVWDALATKRRLVTAATDGFETDATESVLADVVEALAERAGVRHVA